MPTLVWLSLTARRYDRPSGCGVPLADALRTVSRDRLTRMRPGEWSGHTRLDIAVRTRFVWARGCLSIDETVIPKSFATAMEGLAWGFSSQKRRPV